MVQAYAEPNAWQRLLTRYGWGRFVLFAGIGALGLGYLWLSQGSPTQAVKYEAYTEPVEMLDFKPTPPAKMVAQIDDPRWAEFQKELLAMKEAEERQNRQLAEQYKLLQDLLNRKEEKKEPKEKPARRAHRHMGYLAFAPPEETKEKTPVYTLAPGDTKIPCIEETKANSDVENGATVKVSVNVYDTDTRQHLLIPQYATIVQQYRSANLVYGNQRLPMFSTTLTWPNGKKTIDLEETHTLDQEGQAGLVTRVDNHFWRAVPAVLIQGVLRGTQQTVAQMGQPFASGMAQSATQYGQRITQPWIDMRPTIEVDPGEGCTVILQRALQLPAYSERG